MNWYKYSMQTAMPRNPHSSEGVSVSKSSSHTSAVCSRQAGRSKGECLSFPYKYRNIHTPMVPYRYPRTLYMSRLAYRKEWIVSNRLSHVSFVPSAMNGACRQISSTRRTNGFDTPSGSTLRAKKKSPAEPVQSHFHPTRQDGCRSDAPNRCNADVC